MSSAEDIIREVCGPLTLKEEKEPKKKTQRRRKRKQKAIDPWEDIFGDPSDW